MMWTIGRPWEMLVTAMNLKDSNSYEFNSIPWQQYTLFKASIVRHEKSYIMLNTSQNTYKTTLNAAIIIVVI